jgi:hypothetical protein
LKDIYWMRIWLRGCQRVYFQTKNRNLGKFRRIVQWTFGLV